MKHGTIVFAGGGSGGHLFPGIAVAEEIARQAPSLEIVFAGTRKPIEQTILGDRELTCCAIDAAASTLLKRNPVKFLWRYWQSRRQAKRLLERVDARVVVGLGGYASVPIVLAANGLNIPSVLLEQNMIAGRANVWLSHRAEAICHTFEPAAKTTPRARPGAIRITGNPVRREIVLAGTVPNRGHACDAKPTLLILGGSQGATAVNAAVCDSIPQLAGELRHWRVVHQTGLRDADAVKARYAEYDIEHVVAPFFSNMVELYQTAALAVSRAGATSLAELACCGIPAVLIPIPDSLRDHQAENARYFAKAGAAVIVGQQPDSQQTADALSSQLGRLLADTSGRLRMAEHMHCASRPSAARDVAELILELFGETRDHRVRSPKFQQRRRQATDRKPTAGE